MVVFSEHGIMSGFFSIYFKEKKKIKAKMPKAREDDSTLKPSILRLKPKEAAGPGSIPSRKHPCIQ